MRRFLLAGLASLLMASSALAALDVFTSRAAWEAALGGATPIVEDFNGVATPFVFTDGQELVTSVMSIARDGSANGGDGALQILDGSEFGNINGTNFLDGETGATPHEAVRIGFLGASVFAFGGDWSSPFSGDGIGIEVLGDIVLLDSITGFNTGFVGVISDTPFTEASIVGNPAAITFQELWSGDNFSYAVVPEPASTLPLLGALVGLLCWSRRRGQA